MNTLLILKQCVYQCIEFVASLAVDRLHFEDRQPLASAVGKRLAAADRRCQVLELRDVGDSGGGVGVVGRGLAGVGAVEDGEGAEAVADAARLVDQAGDVIERPDVVTARLERDQEDVGEDQRVAERGRVAAAGVDDDVVELAGLLLQLGAF